MRKSIVRGNAARWTVARGVDETWGAQAYSLSAPTIFQLCVKNSRRSPNFTNTRSVRRVNEGMKNTIRIIAIVAVIAGFLSVSTPASARTHRRYYRHRSAIVLATGYGYAPYYGYGSPYCSTGYYSAYAPYYSGPRYYYGRPYYRRPGLSFRIGF
jgi:hypothetical protein